MDACAIKPIPAETIAAYEQAAKRADRAAEDLRHKVNSLLAGAVLRDPEGPGFVRLSTVRRSSWTGLLIATAPSVHREWVERIVGRENVQGHDGHEDLIYVWARPEQLGFLA